MSKARTVCTTALSTGSSERAGVEVGEEPVAEVVQRLLPHLDGGGSEVVDDVVGVAAEGVERPHVVALHRRQQRSVDQ